MMIAFSDMHEAFQGAEGAGSDTSAAAAATAGIPSAHNAAEQDATGMQS